MTTVGFTPLLFFPYAACCCLQSTCCAYFVHAFNPGALQAPQKASPSCQSRFPKSQAPEYKESLESPGADIQSWTRLVKYLRRGPTSRKRKPFKLPEVNVVELPIDTAIDCDVGKTSHAGTTNFDVFASGPTYFPIRRKRPDYFIGNTLAYKSS